MNRRIATTVVGGTTLLAALGGSVVAASTASAAPAAECSSYPTTTDCSASVSATSVAPGAPITLAIKHVFAANESVKVYAHSTPVLLGTYTTDSTGTLSAKVTIPSTLPAGAHTIEAVGANGETASLPFTVTGAAGATGSTTSSDTLPFTGADVAAISAIGGTLLVAGGAAFVIGRRRKPSTDSVA